MDMDMDFFTPIVDESKQNKNFKSVLATFRAAERALFSAWSEGFEDRDGKIVKEFQTTFNSTFGKCICMRVSESMVLIKIGPGLLPIFVCLQTGMSLCSKPQLVMLLKVN